ncbi:MAG TPA: universal stress protein [Methylomirabilota bacterium]|jgi:nucleotide-binding universal stress UspA family protein|nr:universal stress protein [Methylomirabilota bacterium]
MNLETILVPLDGSPMAEAALTPAADLARLTGARLVLLRAGQSATLAMSDPVDAQIDVMQEAQEYLEAVRARVAQAGDLSVETSAWYGPAVESIVDAARYRAADLIVMSSHGRSGVSRLVMGSVAESVLRSTVVPILLIRPHGAALDRPRIATRPAHEVRRV